MPHEPGAINLDQKFAKFSKIFSAQIIAQPNDLHVKAAKIRGDFVWHPGCLTFAGRLNSVVLLDQMFAVGR